MVDLRTSLTTMSLTARVAIGVLSLLLVGGLLVSVAAFAYGRQAAQEAYDRLLLGAANDIASSITVQNGIPRVILPISAFELLALAPDDRIGYRVIGVDSQTLTGYSEITLPESRSRAAVSDYFDAEFYGEPARYAVVSRRFAERTLNGTVKVIVGHTLKARNALAFDITRKALYVVAASAIAMLLLAAVAVRSALKPLERLADQLSRRDPHDLTPMDTRVPREVAMMVTAVNRFMERLDRQMGSMRHLISDTAHQLRTPVAAMRAQADLLEEEEDEIRKKRIVQRIHDRSINLGRLLDQLLSRALVVHRVDSVKREMLDLRDIAVDIYEEGDYSVLAPQADVHLQVDDGPVLVLADSLSLREGLKNLLNNALKHGKAPVTLGASIEAGQAVLWVQDAGPGPDSNVLTQIGERFNLSSRPESNSGSGLGLAIVQSVADAFGGALRMGSVKPAGFRVAMVFALAEKEKA
ncbi:sensor histidine kinase [Roseibium sp. CAU 1637]|uniref:histidine kinase n=1 Tax=Roseibium limicola TaxID=2816037 RepID=A0A939EN77_9HYPH|nr:sensor histidine kinase [Roseibium limicola]MBO0344089.1 sensor histidine kinase [Roseibium limicola]